MAFGGILRGGIGYLDVDAQVGPDGHQFLVEDHRISSSDIFPVEVMEDFPLIGIIEVRTWFDLLSIRCFLFATAGQDPRSKFVRHVALQKRKD